MKNSYEFMAKRTAKNSVKAHGTINCKPCVFFAPGRRSVSDNIQNTTTGWMVDNALFQMKQMKKSDRGGIQYAGYGPDDPGGTPILGNKAISQIDRGGY